MQIVNVISALGVFQTSRRKALRLLEKRGVAAVVQADSRGNPTVIRLREHDGRDLPFRFCWLNTEAAVIRFQGVKARWNGR
jgi:hypothetical protein